MFLVVTNNTILQKINLKMTHGAGIQTHDRFIDRFLSHITSRPGLQPNKSLNTYRSGLLWQHVYSLKHIMKKYWDEIMLNLERS